MLEDLSPRAEVSVNIYQGSLEKTTDLHNSGGPDPDVTVISVAGHHSPFLSNYKVFEQTNGLPVNLNIYIPFFNG